MAMTRDPRAPGARTGVVVLGGDFQSLGAIRLLAARSIPVLLADDEPNIARYSRFLKRRVRMPALREPRRFARRLTGLARSENLEGWILLPNNDELVMLLAKNRDELSEHFLVPVPPWPVARQYYYKNEAYELARKISVPIPRLYPGLTPRDILDQDPAFPLVLKPQAKEGYYPKARKKAVRVDTPEQLRAQHALMASLIDPAGIVVQEFLPGGGRNLFSYAAFFDGRRIVAGFAANRRRQHPPEFGHATTFAVAVDIPELRDQAERLLREIGFYGLAEVEFMRDEREGVYKFIEINGRIWGWHTLANAAGVDILPLLYADLTGRDVRPGPARAGAKWVRLMTDLPTCAKEILSGRMTFGDYLHSMSGPKEFAVLTAKDPLPFLMELVLAPYLWWKRGF